MSLYHSRARLALKVRSGDFLDDMTKAPEAALQLVRDWFGAYKSWEARDTFAKAFYANRMAMRTWSDENTKSHLLRIARNRISNRTGTATAETENELLGEFDNANYGFAVGLLSLAQRTTPANFNGVNGASQKYSLGLHDMSSTLLDSRKTISEQAHKKDDGTIFSFCPLPEADDLVLFSKLNRMGKAMVDTRPALREMMRDIASKMTRVRLAAEHDMGTGFTAVRRDGTTAFKLKYGLGAFTKIVTGFETDESGRPVPGSGKLGGGRLGTGVRVTDEMWRARQEQALDYTDILRRQLFAKNEITVSYRQHDGPFPLFAIYDATNGVFNGFQINEDGGKDPITGVTIVDNMPLRG